MNKNIQDISDAAGILNAHKHHALAERLVQMAESMVDPPDWIRIQIERREALNYAAMYRYLLDSVITERDQIRNERDALKKQIEQLSKL